MSQQLKYCISLSGSGTFSENNNNHFLSLSRLLFHSCLPLTFNHFNILLGNHVFPVEFAFKKRQMESRVVSAWNTFECEPHFTDYNIEQSERALPIVHSNFYHLYRCCSK